MNPMISKWQKDFDKTYAGYKANGFSDQHAWSWACDRANDAWRAAHPINGSDDRSMYGPT